MQPPLVIGITGGSGSGKTTFMRRLYDHFGAEKVCVVGHDNYYLPAARQQRDERGEINFDLPTALDREALLNDIQALINGRIVQRLEYLFEREDKEPGVVQLEPAPVLIIEGIFVLHFAEIRKLLDLSIFVHARETHKIIRRIKRDRIERHYPLDVVLYRYENHVLPTFDRYVKPYKESADLVVNNTDGFERAFRVVRGYVEDYLNKKRNGQ